TSAPTMLPGKASRVPRPSRLRSRLAAKAEARPYQGPRKTAHRIFTMCCTGEHREIGRASCRERVKMKGGGRAEKRYDIEQGDGIGFFFSSRGRHTSSKRDWSSDVCSSDLTSAPTMLPGKASRVPRPSRLRSRLAAKAEARPYQGPRKTAHRIFTMCCTGEHR